MAEEVDGLAPGQRARVIANASYLPLLGRLDIDRAEATARRAVRIAREHASEGAQPTCAYTLAVVSYLRGHFSQAIAWAAKARVTGEDQPSDRVGLGWQHGHQAAVLLLARLSTRLTAWRSPTPP